jgi:hypothetical protein
MLRRPYGTPRGGSSRATRRHPRASAVCVARIARRCHIYARFRARRGGVRHGGGADAARTPLRKLPASQVALPLAWARTNQTLARVTVTHACSAAANDSFVSMLNLSVDAAELAAVRLFSLCFRVFRFPGLFVCALLTHSRALRACPAQARRVGAVALVAGPACAFNRTIDYFSGAPPPPFIPPLPHFPLISAAPLLTSSPPACAAFADMSIALAPTAGAGALGGVVFGEGYAGKVPELVTPSYAASGALVGWADTAVPTCVMYNAVRMRKQACVRVCAGWEENGGADTPRCVCASAGL